MRESFVTSQLNFDKISAVKCLRAEYCEYPILVVLLVPYLKNLFVQVSSLSFVFFAIGIILVCGLSLNNLVNDIIHNY